MSASSVACFLEAGRQSRQSLCFVTSCTSRSVARNKVKARAWQYLRDLAWRSALNCACSETPAFLVDSALAAPLQSRWGWVYEQRVQRDFQPALSLLSPSHLYWRCKTRRRPRRHHRWEARWAEAWKLSSSAVERKQWKPHKAQFPVGRLR